MPHITKEQIEQVLDTLRSDWYKGTVGATGMLQSLLDQQEDGITALKDDPSAESTPQVHRHFSPVNLDMVTAQLAGAEAEIAALKQGLHRASLQNEAVQKDAAWIPVSERLPLEDDGTVAVLCSDGTQLTAWACYWHGASKAFNNWQFPVEIEDYVRITHWARLPIPPIAGEAT